MKKRACIFGALIAVLLVISAMAVSSFAVTNIAGNTVKDGVSYKLSDNGEYYTVVGPADVLPSLTVASSIDGIPVTEIAESAFQNNEYLNDITIPSSVKTIGKAAFRNCKNLVKVTLPPSVTVLPVECFYECRVLKEINLPSKLEVISDDCFNTCTMLKNLKIPASVTEIGHDAFLNCESLLLDVSKNGYAAEYAERENINTDFMSTTEFFLIIVGGAAVFGLILFILLSKVAKKYFEKHPSHNPAIYIGRFFSYIGKGISFVFGKLEAFFKFIFSKIRAALKKENGDGDKSE